MINIISKHNIVVATVRSDAEAARWFLDSGHEGDKLEDTGEALADVVGIIFEDAEWHFDAFGTVRTTVHPD